MNTGIVLTCKDSMGHFLQQRWLFPQQILQFVQPFITAKNNVEKRIDGALLASAFQAVLMFCQPLLQSQLACLVYDRRRDEWGYGGSERIKHLRGVVGGL